MMGYTRSTASAWDSHTASTKSASYDSLYKARPGTGVKADDTFDPKNISVRESRDSDVNPDSTPIIIALDGTGSMTAVLASCMKGLGVLFNQLYDKRPVSDPHIMAMILDDIAVGSPHSLQVSQFESDKVIVEQLAKLYVDGNGGGNSSESYHLPLYFAATRTEADAFKKGRKGFLFTIGDEETPEPLTTTQLKAVFGADASDTGPISYLEAFQMASENYHVFHIIVEQGSHPRYARGGADGVKQRWADVIGQHAIPLSDVNSLAEVIVGVIQVIAGEDKAVVAAGFSSGKDLVVAHAIGGLTAGGSASGGVARL